MNENPSEIVSHEFVLMLHTAIKSAYPDIAVKESDLILSISTPNSGMGDISSSIAFRFAKDAKKAPQQIAKEIISQIKPSTHIKEVNELNGYINALIDTSTYAKTVLTNVTKHKERYGSSNMGGMEKIITEFPSLNPIHPFVVSHLRNAILGDSISNILEFCSYNVERIDYINDQGLQVAEALWGYMNISDKPDKKFDQWLGELYVLVNQRINENEKDMKDRINILLKEMEDLDGEIAKKARWMSEQCVLAQNGTEFSYNISHNALIWESDVIRSNIVGLALDKIKGLGIAHIADDGKYEGCLVIDLEKAKDISKELQNQEEDVKVLVRSNGIATYVAKDLAFHMWKFGLLEPHFKYIEFSKQANGKFVYSTSRLGKEMHFGNAKKAVNIIGSEQRFPQLVLRAIFKLMGHDEIEKNLFHLAYGRVELEESSLSSRGGNWLGKKQNYTADDLLEEAKKKVLKVVKESKRMTDKSEEAATASAVALGAIKFEYLRISPERKLVFSWEKALNFEGDSGPYCMYTYTRAKRILEKGEFKSEKLTQDDYKNISRDVDFELIKLLGKASSIVEKACIEYKPNVIADYLLDLCSAFSKFYEKMPVLKGGDAKNIRLEAVAATMQTIENMLRLLGIEPVEAM